MRAVAKEAAREHEAASVLEAAADILEHSRADLIHGQPAIDAAALWMLYAAVTGRSNGKSMNGSDRKQLLDAAMRTLTPAIDFYAHDDQQRAWVAEHITPQVAELGTELEISEAEARVRGAMVLPGGRVVDPNDDSHPREQAEALHEALPKLVDTVMQLNEMIVGLHDKEIEEQIERMLDGLEPEGSTKIGSLVELGNVLSVVSGYLMLSDEELTDHLRNGPGGWSRAGSASELVKAVVAFTAGALGVVTSGIGLVARAAGEPEIARLCAGFARGLGLTVGSCKHAGPTPSRPSPLRFELPEVAERAKLWRAMLPAAAPVDAGVDFGGLARRFAMSGGYIRNAALRAAFLAADEDSAITQAHLEHAAQLEYEGMGKITVCAA